MEETAIKLLYINSKVHALININQSPAGETGIAAVTQPIAANSSFSSLCCRWKTTTFSTCRLPAGCPLPPRVRFLTTMVC